MSDMKLLSQYVVAVGGPGCGKTLALNALAENSESFANPLSSFYSSAASASSLASPSATGAATVNKKFALRIPYTEGLREGRVEHFLSKKRCTAIIVEALLDVDAKDAFADMIKEVVQLQKHAGKHVFQETRSFFEVPRALRVHASAVLVFRSANDDERRRVYRSFANAFYAQREEFDAALDALQRYECLLLDKTSNRVCVFDAKQGVKQVRDVQVANGERNANDVKKENEEKHINVAANAKDTQQAETTLTSENNKKPLAEIAQNAEKGEKKPLGYRKWFWSWFGY